MTILTAVFGSGARRRCDSTCHHAKHPVCRCVCGGRYHGVGAQAFDLLTQDMLSSQWGEIHAGFVASTGDTAQVVAQQLQLALPGGEG